MTVGLPPGKLPAALLAELLQTLPAADPAVRLGPAVGEDAAAIDVAEGTLVVATDPITLTGSRAGHYAVIVNANDVAVTGALPRWFLLTMLLPPGTEATEVRELFAGLTDTLEATGITLVGGHSEITSAVNQPLLVGQMLGWLPRDRLIATGGVTEGDRVVQVGGVPIEGAAVLAAEARDRLSGLEPGLLEAAARADREPGISVVDAALAAAAAGATAMHDPTEGGLAAGLGELAQASAVALEIDGDAIAFFAPGLAVCRALAADPWATLASGCLLATFPPDRVEAALSALHAAGHEAVVIGRAVSGAGVKVDGRALALPERDEVARLLG